MDLLVDGGLITNTQKILRPRLTSFLFWGAIPSGNNLNQERMGEKGKMKASEEASFAHAFSLQERLFASYHLGHWRFF